MRNDFAGNLPLLLSEPDGLSLLNNDHTLFTERQEELLANFKDLPAAWRQRIAGQQAVNLLDRDPKEATRWIEGLPQGNVRDQTLKNLALNWRNLDPTGAESWINGLPEGDAASVKEFFHALDKPQ